MEGASAPFLKEGDTVRIEYVSAVGTYTATFTYPMHYVYIVNDGTDPLNLNLNGDNITLVENSAWYGDTDQFLSFIVTGTSEWRAEVRGEDPLGSLTANEIFIGVKYELGDLPPTKVSSYQFIDALNFTLNMIGIALSNLDSSLIMKEYPFDGTTLNITTAGVTLPTDFLSIVSVTDSSDDPCTPVVVSQRVLESGQYKIMGSKIYGDIAGANIIYKASILQVTEETDMVYLPDNFEGLLRKYVKAIITNKIDSADAAVLPMLQQEVYNLVGGREYTEIYREPPFMV